MRPLLFSAWRRVTSEPRPRLLEGRRSSWHDEAALAHAVDEFRGTPQLIGEFADTKKFAHRLWKVRPRGQSYPPGAITFIYRQHRNVDDYGNKPRGQSYPPGDIS